MSKAKTKDEIRTAFLDYIHKVVEYWSSLPEETHTVKDKCDGVAFSILNIFDGTTLEFCAMDIVLRPHPDDKEFLQNQGEDWFEDGMAFNDNDECLHHLYYAEGKTK